MDDTAFIAVMGTQLAHYARENADLRKRVEELEQVIAASGLGHAQVDVTRLEEVERERDRLQQELRTTTLTVEQTRRENERLAEEYQLRCRTLEMEVCDLRTDRDKVKHAWRKTISELDRLTKETEGLQELSSLKNQLSEVAEDNNRTKEERENICRELLKSVQTVKSLRIAKVDLQQAADKALEERDQLVDQHNQRLANESEAHARQLADCKKTYEQQLWTLQADYARQFLHEKEAYARQLAEEREVHEHQVTKLHADLCEQIKLVDKTRTSYIELGNENASLRYEAERAHKLEAQVCELRIQLRATITQHDDMKTELANMVVTLSHMDHEKNDAQNAAEAGRRAEADRCGLLKKLQQIAAENEGLARQLDTVRADAAEKSRLLDSTTARVERSQQELQELRAGLEEDKEGRAELEKEYARAVDQLVDRESELAECVASLEKMREEKSIVDQVMEELKDVCPSWQELPRLVHELSSNKETLAQTLTELEGDATQKEASLRETTAALDKAREESSSLREELKVSLDTVASFQPLHLQVGLLNQQVTSLQAELDTRGAAIADLQSKSTSANSAYEVSVSRLAEETATKNECERRREEACQEVEILKQQLLTRETEVAALRASMDSIAQRSASQAVTGSSQVPSDSASTGIRRSPRKRAKIQVYSESDMEDQDVICISSLSGRSRMAHMLTSYISPIPEGRIKVFDDLRHELDPGLAVPDDLAEMTHFTKTELANALGGNKQSLIVTIAKDSLKLLSRNLGITGYLCPKLNQNPWCPYAPGKDGYMFVGLGGDAVRLVEPYVWPLFVNVSEDQSSKLFFSGFYEVCKAEDVTVEEWSTVPDHIKSQYCQTTKDKVLECYNKPLQQIKAEYQSGSRRAPCRRLRFVGWRNPSKPNMDIYQALVDHFSGRFRVSGSTQDSASVSPAK